MSDVKISKHFLLLTLTHVLSWNEFESINFCLIKIQSKRCACVFKCAGVKFIRPCIAFKLSSLNASNSS